ncbi:MAG: hypothetical protein L6461_21725 [Anaerolineae bacterium]|nr:hypothetical protein [Anaerolineae bacterium]
MDKAITNSNFEIPLITLLLNSTKYFKKDAWYFSKILRFASQLNTIYGGDIDIICVAILLGNYGVRFPEFLKTDDLPSALTNDLLAQIQFPNTKIKLVDKHLTNQRSQDFSPVTLEGQIIHDAVLLASFGASGIVRYAMWSELSNTDIRAFKNIDEVFHERIGALIFPESIILAEKENKFLYLFSALLEKESNLEKKLPGKYIILEGNSGVGKNTQAKRLREHLEKNGKKVVIIEEPSESYKKYENFWLANNNNDIVDDIPFFRLFSIIGDRGQQIYQNVYKELALGNIVISVRSFLSMLVYQCENDFDRKKINYIHQFIPRPDIMIVYDADEKVCLESVVSRCTKLTYFDKLKSLEKYRPIYLEVAKSSYFDFPIEIVDASGELDDVVQKTIDSVSKYL